MVFWKYPVSLPVEVGCGVSQGKVSFRSAAFRASRTKRGLIKKKEIARAFKVGSAACDLISFFYVVAFFIFVHALRRISFTTYREHSSSLGTIKAGH